jgi:hypothetical protein
MCRLSWNLRACTFWNLMGLSRRVMGLLYLISSVSFISLLPLPVPVAAWSSLRRTSTVARLLQSWVQIPQGAWMFVCCECCVLSGRNLCDELITRPEESYRLWRVVVCDQETSCDEVAMKKRAEPLDNACSRKSIWQVRAEQNNLLVSRLRVIKCKHRCVTQKALKFACEWWSVCRHIIPFYVTV